MALAKKLAINSLFNKLGVEGVFKSQKVYFLLLAPDEIVDVGFMRTQTASTIIKIRISDIPNLKIGDKIISEETGYTVMATPRKDLHQLIWTAEVLCD